MPSDKELYIKWKTEYGTFTGAEVAEIFASEYNLSSDSLRGRLSRSATNANRVEVGRILSQPRDVEPSVQRQLDIIDNSIKRFEARKKEWDKLNRPIVGYFISDMHRGAKFRDDYWLLTLNILEDEKHVDCYSALNDWQDNNGYGRWDDTRSPRQKLWSSDVANAFAVEDYDYSTIHEITGADGLAVNGNHDNWIFSYARTNSMQNSEKFVADRMETLYDNNVLLFNRMQYQNSICLSKGLIWEHGVSSAKRATSRGRNALSKHMKDGIAKTVANGHAHRPALVKGDEVDINGVYFVSTGTFQDAREVPYARDNVGNGWGGAIARFEFMPSSRYVNVSLIEFKDRGSQAVAIANGRQIANVPLM